MDRGKNQCVARAVPPIAGSSRTSALHLLRLLLPRLLPDRTQEAFLKQALFNLRATCHRPHDRLKYYPPLQEPSAIPAWLRRSEPRLRYSPGLAPTTRLNALLNAASDS